MKTGNQKADKRNTQLNSPAGATPAVMFPKESDEELAGERTKTSQSTAESYTAQEW